MALKKSQIYSSLWQSCDELRGGMDASQYKDYVLTLLFMKYVSDRWAGDPGALIVVPPGGGFADMAALKGDKEIGDRINKIIGRLAEANDLKGVIDQADFNDESRLGAGREMQDRLSRLVAIFEGLDFRANRAGGDDLLGDAYEYLMRHFATESGKSKGQFYTPAEVSRVMAQVVGVGPDTRSDQTLYDPACGSGSLLLQAADRAPGGISVYGQEMDNATWALARMNMILHGHPTADLRRGNTLAAPEFRGPGGGLKTFDFAVANPPFSAKAWSNGLDPAHDVFERFAYGVPPAKNGDYAFLLHLVASLRSTGRGAVILPHGVLFRGAREAGIRRELLRRGFVKGVVGLPANLFYGTGIPACIVVVDKAHAHTRKGVFLVDASRGFRKDGPKNRLRDQDVHRIVDVFNRQVDVPGYARMAPLAEIADPANDWNLNIPRYVDAGEPEDLHDLDAHLRGGVPDRDLDALGDCWRVFPSLRDALFERIPGRAGYSRPRVDARQVGAAVRNHDEFRAYRKLAADVFAIWRGGQAGRLRGLHGGDAPAEIIEELSEALLETFADFPLLDRYDVYQCLMDYWEETMRDDVGLVAAAGWVEAARPRVVAGNKTKTGEAPDLTVGRQKYKMDLIPPALIAARCFTDEQAAVEKLRAEREAAAGALEAFVEEHAGDEGALVDAANEKGKVTRAGAKARLRALRDEPDDPDDPAGAAERDTLRRCLALMDAEAAATKAARAAQTALDRQVLERYAALTETEIRTLVVDDKWFAGIRAAVDGEVQRVTQSFAARLKELDERYARPLPELEQEVAALGVKVEGHLRRMGVAP